MTTIHRCNSVDKANSPGVLDKLYSIMGYNRDSRRSLAFNWGIRPGAAESDVYLQRAQSGIDRVVIRRKRDYVQLEGPCVDPCRIKVLQIKGRPVLSMTMRTRSCSFPSAILDWQRVSWTIGEYNPDCPLLSFSFLFFHHTNWHLTPSWLFPSTTRVCSIFIKANAVEKAE